MRDNKGREVRVIKYNELTAGMTIVGNSGLDSKWWDTDHKIIEVIGSDLLLNNITGFPDGYRWSPPRGNIDFYILDEIGPEYGEICP